MKINNVGVLSLALIVATGTSLVLAQDYGNGNRGYGNNRYDDNAQVIRVTRTNDQRTSYQPQQCWNEQTNNYDDGYYRDRNGGLYREEGRKSGVGGAVIGGLVGGAAGSQVGKGDGKTAATIAGVVIGAMIGNSVATKSNSTDQYSYRENNGTVRRCRTTGGYADYGYDPRNQGYNVTYRYAGRNYQTVTRQNPGRYLPIVVDVRPRDNNGNNGNGYRQ